MVTKASDQVQADARERSTEYRAAYDRLGELHERGELSEADLQKFAAHGEIDETSIALSLLCRIRIEIIERTLVHGHTDQILVLAKSIGLSWATTKAILLLGMTAKERSKYFIEHANAMYSKLQQETARKAVEFYRLRDRAAGRATR
jgi:hypothetical protein